MGRPEFAIQFRLHGQVAGQSRALSYDDVHLNFYESNDNATWGDPLTDDPVVIDNGGSVAVVKLHLSKTFLKIEAKCLDGIGAMLRVDVGFNGRLYEGQLELNVIGKSGYGKDGGSGHAEEQYEEDTWPVEESSSMSSESSEEVGSPP